MRCMIIHLTIWFIVYFGCLFNSTLNKFNLLILLPVIFIAQSLPFHPIMYTKMKYIKENFNAHNDNNLCDEEKEDMKRLSRIFNEPYDKILEYYSTYMNNNKNNVDIALVDRIISHKFININEIADNFHNKIVIPSVIDSGILANMKSREI